MNSALWQLTLARFREFYREPAALFWVYGFPLILSFALGMAFRETPVPPASVDIQSDANDPAVAGLRAVLTEDQGLKVEVHDETAARQRLRTSKTDLVIVPRPHTAGGPEFVYDKTRSEGVLARNAVERTLLRSKNQQLPPDQRLPEPTERTVSEPGSRYIDFLIPGLLGINLLGGGLFGVGFAVTDLRVRKLLKRFAATPMRRSDFMISLMLSRLVFTLIDVALLLTFAYFVFDIEVRGNALAFVVLIAAGGACFAGLGLLIGARAKTLETAAGLVNALMLPMYVLSGVFFSASRFPDAVQPFIQALPLTALNDGLRAIMNDGAGWEALGYPLLVLGIWGVACYAIAFKIFRWK
jgi:ABC-type multidrug transport system permease subunit